MLTMMIMMIMMMMMIMMPGPLRHPAYVYAATFHPATASIIVTGGFDRVLRVWRREDGGGYTVKQVSGLAG